VKFHESLQERGPGWWGMTSCGIKHLFGKNVACGKRLTEGCGRTEEGSLRPEGLSYRLPRVGRLGMTICDRDKKKRAPEEEGALSAVVVIEIIQRWWSKS
jgi:hypothetical protein